MAQWFPFYPGDYLRDTMHLSTAEHGAYLLLIVCLWSTQALPDDDQTLAQVTKLSAEDWKRARPKLEPFFRIEEGQWFHDRVDLEREKANRRMDKASAGGRARAARNVPKQSASTPEAELPGCGPQPQPQEKKKDSQESPSEEVQRAVEIWNETATRLGLPRCQAVTKTRVQHLRARLRECGGLDGWKAAIEKVAASRFLTGQTPEGFRASFDFVITASKFTRICEGNYDDKKPKPAGGNGFHDLVRSGGLERVISGDRGSDAGQPGAPDWLADHDAGQRRSGGDPEPV